MLESMEKVATMDKSVKNDKLLKQICIDYYIHNKTQQQIANKLFISRSTVSRNLTLAKKKNYVSYNLNFEIDKLDIYRDKILKKYKLQQLEAFALCVIDDDFDIEFNKQAANAIDKHIKYGTSIACSWGSFINDIIDYLPQRNVPNLKVIQLYGDITSDPLSHNQSGVIKNFAQKYNADFYQLSAPLHVDSKEVKQSLLKLKIIDETLNLLDNSDIILTGIGALDNYGKYSIWEQFQNESKFNEAIELGGIAYFCSYIIGSDGEILDCEYNKCNIAISQDRIKDKKVILLVSEMYKYEAIKAVLKANMIDCLITSNEIAKRLYEDD